MRSKRGRERASKSGQFLRLLDLLFFFFFFVSSSGAWLTKLATIWNANSNGTQNNLSSSFAKHGVLRIGVDRAEGKLSLV